MSKGLPQTSHIASKLKLLSGNFMFFFAWFIITTATPSELAQAIWAFLWLVFILSLGLSLVIISILELIQ